MRATRPPQPPPEPEPRTSFGPYMLIERIAVGGMAEIFTAAEPRDVGEARTLVIKRMLPALREDDEARAMFEAEGKLGVMITHENVVRHFGGGEVDGSPYLSLELVPGLDLWRLLRWLTRHGQTMGVPLALYIARSILEGLEAIHSAADERGENLRVVHRDVSPSNVLLSVHGDVKIADLGIATSRFAGANVTGRAKGKLAYLSPEQVQGMQVDRRADVYSAAVVAAEMLTGKPLFSGGSELAILLAIRDGDLRTLLDHTATLPHGLTEVMQAALTVDPNRRTASAAMFHDALVKFDDTPPAVLRRELGELVRSASAAANGEDTVGLPTPLQEITNTEDAFTPTIVSPTTAEMPALDYRVQTTAGKMLGPWSYARAVEAVATAEVGSDDLVSVGEGPFARILEITNLARHLPLASLNLRASEADLPRVPNETFTLDEGGFMYALTQMILNEETGLLLCERGGTRKEVYLRKGRAEFVTSNLAGELLGEFLVARGVISRGELDMALAVIPRYEGRLGDTLAALGLIEPVHLFNHIAAQVREKLLDLFLWDSGRASFWRGVEAPVGGFPLHLESWAVMDEGISRRVAQGLEARITEAPTRTAVRLATSPTIDTSLLPMDAQRMLGALVTPRTIEDLVKLPVRKGTESGAALRWLVLLSHLGVVEVAVDPRNQ